MQGDDAPAGAVIVYHQIVHAYHGVMCHHQLFDLLDQQRIRRLAQQRTDGIPCGLYGRPQNKQRHQQARPAVQLHAAPVAHKHGQQHSRGGRCIAETVRRGGGHGG